MVTTEQIDTMRAQQALTAVWGKLRGKHPDLLDYRVLGDAG